jgi:UDP-N-acetylmuramate dehydrogenase
MKVYKNVSLKKYNTFGLDHKADFLIKVSTEKEAAALFNGTFIWKKPLFILGCGSNILFTGDYKGTILYPELGGIEIEEKEKDNIIISAGAGIIWDELVEWTVNKGFGGLENLSLIPGKVGATPVQNIGAYGVEVKDKIVKIKAIRINDGSSMILSNKECEFGYRNSIFKTKEKGNYLVTRVFFRLSINPVLDLSYGTLKEEVNKLGSETLKNVRQCVIKIRRSKLADPEKIGNAGSFFKNPVVSSSVALRLKNEYPDMPQYKDQEGSIKLAAGWLIERCGLKGKRTGDAGVYDKQALVLVNYGKASGQEILNLSEEIKYSVREKFGIYLEREVEVIGSI